eukprot:6461908-Amphidinium_carterae.1
MSPFLSRHKDSLEVFPTISDNTSNKYPHYKHEGRVASATTLCYCHKSAIDMIDFRNVETRLLGIVRHKRSHAGRFKTHKRSNSKATTLRGDPVAQLSIRVRQKCEGAGRFHPHNPNPPTAPKPSN